MQIEHKVSGIPCQVLVKSYNRVPGTYRHDAPSSADYYGYTEVSYEILDTRGRKAEWLERKLTEEARTEIERLISSYYEE